MTTLRRSRFRFWIAISLIGCWLSTVMACSLDTDALAAPVLQLGSAGHSTHTGGDTPDDPCCQVQANAITSSDAIKLPQATIFPVIVPLSMLASAISVELFSVPTAPDRNPHWRRSLLLFHSLQAQAPPL